jgi:hypothetical protein
MCAILISSLNMKKLDRGFRGLRGLSGETRRNDETAV